MELNIEVQEYQPFAVLTLDGWLAQAEVYKLKHECHRLVEYAGHHFLIIDLSRVTFIDSSGVGVLVHLDKTCKAVGGQVTIVQPDNTIVLETLYAVSLQRFIDFFTDVQTALNGICCKFSIPLPADALSSRSAPAGPGGEPPTVEQLQERIRQLEARLAYIEERLCLNPTR